MTLTDKILSLFSAYQDLRSREQKVSEENLALRLRCVDLESKLDGARQDMVDRERDLLNKVMAGSVVMRPSPGKDGPQVLPPTQSTAYLTPAQWKRKKDEEFWAALETRRQTRIHTIEGGKDAASQAV